MVSNGHLLALTITRYFRPQGSIQQLRRTVSSTKNLSRSTKPSDVLFFGTDLYSIYAFQSFLRSMDTNAINIGRLGVCSRFHEPLCELAKFTNRAKLSRDIVTIDYRNISSSLPLQGWDIGVLASFGHLLPEDLIASFPYGILCIHPSLLPRYRGAAPLVETIRSGDKVSGVSLMSIAPKKFDVGPVVSQEAMEVPVRCTTRQVGELLMGRGVELLEDALKDLPKALAAAKPQSSDGVSYAKKVTARKTFVDWNWTMDEIDRFYRAVHEDFGVRTLWEGKVANIGNFAAPEVAKSAKIDELCPSGSSPGSFYFHKKRRQLFVRCSDGWVGVDSVSLPDRRPMLGVDFYNGFLSPEKYRAEIFESVTKTITTKKSDHKT